MTWQRDRRPVVLHDAFGALYGDNAQGLDPTWRTAPATRIAELQARAAGATPFIGVSMPQGATTGNAFCVTLSAVLPSAVDLWVTNEAPRLKAAGWRLVLYTGSYMPRVGGTGDAEQNATSQACGLEATAIPFGTSDVTWVLDNCLNKFGPHFDRVFFDAMGLTSGEMDTLDAVRAACRTRGWFPGGVGGEPIPLTYSGSPRPNTPSAQATRAPCLSLSSFNDSRDNFFGQPSPQIGTWNVNPATTEQHIALDASIAAYGSIEGPAYLDSLVRRGFIVSLMGDVFTLAPWVRAWWNGQYGTQVRGERA